MFCALSLCLTKRLNMENSEQFLVQFLNRHPDKATRRRVEAKATNLYLTGCLVIFGRLGVYIEPLEDNAGNSTVMSYDCHCYLAVKSIQAKRATKPAELRDLIRYEAEPLIKRSIEYMNDLFSKDNLI